MNNSKISNLVKEKKLKTFLKIVLIIIGIILLDTMQALIFDNNPIIGIDTKCCLRRGILVDTYYCDDKKRDTVIKGFSRSCAYNGGNYILVDETKNIKDFSCAEELESFYEDDNYTYYWSCLKDKYMIVKYNDGKEEKVSDALRNKHIDIQVLDKFNINYIKEEK